MKKKKEENNPYKIGFIVLAAIIAIFVVFYSIGAFANSKYEKGLEDGREEAVLIISSAVVANGFVNLELEENQSITLVSSEVIPVAQEQVIRELISSVENEGYVRVFDETNQYYLVPTQPPQN